MSWQQIPFVRLLLPLVLGILAYQNFDLSPPVSGLISLFILSLSLLVLLSLKKRIGFRWVRSWGLLLFFVVLQLGWWIAYQQDERQHKQHLIYQKIDSSRSYLVCMYQNPTPKTRHLRSKVRLLGYFDQVGHFKHSIGKLLLSIQLDSAALKLSEGDTLLLNGRIHQTKAPLNPQSIDFRKIYAQEGIYHQAYIPKNQWKLLGKHQGFYYRKFFQNCQQYLLKLLKKHLRSPNEYAVAAALLLGSKTALDSSLKEAYAESGAMHVLAVSGLHVGLLMLLMNRIMGRPKKRITRRLKYILLLLFLWFFAFLTGASASVLRAATMFSFVLIGQAIHRKTSIYNTLAASAFVLLCIDTSLLQQIGFQLSYLAILGIVYLYPKINKCFYFENRIARYIWSGIAVSLAAQIAVSPLSIYYFHQFPVYFWLSGLAVGPFAALILSLGIAFFIFHSLPIIGSLIVSLLYCSLWLMNSLIFAIQTLPFAALNGFWLEHWQLMLLYAALACILLSFRFKNIKWAITAAAVFLSLGLFRLNQLYQQNHQHYLCFYHCKNNLILSTVYGRKCTLISDRKLDKPHQIRFAVQQHLWSLGVIETQHFGLTDSVRQAEMIFENGKGIIADKTVFVYGPDQVRQNAYNPLDVDYLVIHNNPKIEDIKDIERLCHYQKIIFAATNFRYNTKKWKQQCDDYKIDYVDIAQKGAFEVTL